MSTKSTKSKTPIIEIEKGDSGTFQRFYSLGDVRNWLDKEQASWDWLLQLTEKPNTIDRELRKVKQSYKRGLSAIDSAVRSTEAQEADPPDYEKLRSSLDAYFDSLIPATEPRAKFVFEAAEADPNVAFRALKWFMKEPINPSKHEDMQGAVQAILFEMGIKNRAPGEKRALKNLRDTWDQRLNEQTMRFQTSVDQAEREVENAGQVSGTQQAEFNEMMRNASAELARLEETYDKRLALAKPVKYWRKKGFWHYVASGAAFAVAAAGATIFFSWFIAFLGFVDGEFEKPTTLSKTPFQHFILLTLALGLFAWGLRIVIRFLLSQLHQASDARQRATMVLTYLALLREGSGLDEGDKKLIFSTLFRPNQTGLLREETSPITGLDLVQRVFGGGRPS